MEFFNEAVRTLETIVEALNRTFGKDYPPRICGYPAGTAERPDFGKTMVRVKKHVRPPVRADPKKRCGAGRQKPVTDSRQTNHFKTGGKYMGFFTTAVSTMSTLVVALGGGVGVWGVINLMEGYGSDNPASMLMYGKEASKQKQEIDRQHHTIPNQKPKTKRQALWKCA